ncbi:MAG TPA: hypothetical protein VFQ61_39310, partial [Polyangiaceae bacterium]|nr:hypothetical protein [Polyangiaceae bacterium]
MSDEHSKKVSSTPPPPTDAVDQSWSNTPEPGRVDLGKPVTSTAVAPGVSAQDIRRATRHAEEEELDDDDEDEDEDEDEDSDEDEDEGEHEEAPARALSGTNRSGASNDWLPDWAPYAVLGA